jgi:CheY-like chemotaxis protein
MVDEIHKAGERAAMLTGQLLAFGRQQMLEPQVLDLNDVVADTEIMLRRLIGEDIIVSLSLDPSLRRIKADPGQIQQILMNLVVNARDAMPQGGTLSIETKNITVDKEYCQSHPGARPGEFALLAVIDEGTGIDEQTRAHIFEPFFTTKEVGKGTGLGLAMVFGIAKRSGGYIHVESEMGRGTSFELYFPVCTSEESHAQRHELPLTPKGHETLLLVEDDEAVRVMARHILQSYGYNVLEAAGGPQAIQLAESHQGPIDLLVTDVVMPHMSGRKLAEQLASLQPRIKVLFLSGYTDDSVIQHGVLQAGFAFLQKPFTSASLSSKVRDVLDTRS